MLHVVAPGSDPGIGFHVSRGANVDAIVPGWRPEDEDNGGTGVLVRYDLNEFELLRATTASFPPNLARGRIRPVQLPGHMTAISSEFMAQAADKQYAGSLLSQIEALVRKVGGAIDFNIDAPLLEAGLDSYLLPQVADELSTLAGVPQLCMKKRPPFPTAWSHKYMRSLR